jgi:hypothetical protein
LLVKANLNLRGEHTRVATGNMIWPTYKAAVTLLTRVRCPSDRATSPIFFLAPEEPFTPSKFRAYSQLPLRAPQAFVATLTASRRSASMLSAFS